MKLGTKRSEYAVFAVWELARAYRSRRPVSARKIAAKYGLSFLFLSRILQDLRGVNIIEAVRGPNGGFRLLVPPEELTLGYVISVVEDVGRSQNSTKPKSDQKELSDDAIRVKDKLTDVWKKADERRQEFLNRIVFSDLIQDAEEERPLNFSI